MDLSAILAGIGGAARGGFEGFSWQEGMNLDKKKQADAAALKEADITSREQIAKLREEIRVQLETLKETGRSDRHDTPSGTAVLNEEGRNDRYGRPSGNAVLAEEGRNDRWGTPSGNAVLADAGATQRHVTPSGSVLSQISAANQRWATPSGNATLGAETTRRGQDLGQQAAAQSTDARRFAASEATRRARLRGQQRDPWSSVTFDPATSGEMPVTPLAPATPSGPLPSGGTDPIYKWSDGTTRMYPEGGAAAQVPVTPPAATPPAQPQSPDAVVDRDAQRRATFETIRTEIENRKKKGQAYDDLIKQLKKLRTGGAQ